VVAFLLCWLQGFELAAQSDACSAQCRRHKLPEGTSAHQLQTIVPPKWVVLLFLALDRFELGPHSGPCSAQRRRCKLPEGTSAHQLHKKAITFGWLLFYCVGCKDLNLQRKAGMFGAAAQMQA